MYSRIHRLRTALSGAILALAASGASALVAFAANGGGGGGGGGGDTGTRRDQVKLLEPISGGDTINISPGIGTWLEYFESAYGWIYQIAVGICIIWMLIGGIMIMTSGDQAERRQTGIRNMKASIAGLVVFIFSGPILRFLNSYFFK